MSKFFLITLSIMLLTILFKTTSAQFKLNALALKSLDLNRKGFTLQTTGLKPISQKSLLFQTSNCSTNCSTLPLTLFELTGNRKNDNEVNLYWKTENEINNTGFYIERSVIDAIHFEITGNMVATSTDNSIKKKYAVIDNNNNPGKTFYRIKQVDINGNFTYSNTIIVAGYKRNETLWLFPNPANNKTIATCFSNNTGKAELAIFSGQGQRVYQNNLYLNKGDNNFNLPIGLFAPGVYYVQLLWPDKYNTSTKLIIIRP